MVKNEVFAKNQQNLIILAITQENAENYLFLAKYLVFNHTNPKSLQNNILFLSYEKNFETKILVPWD